MTEGERLKALRKELDIKQGDFSEKISTTQGHISDIENGRKALSERTIKLICLENWNGKTVNESWLRTGEGEMFNKTTASNIALNRFNHIMGNASNQKKAVLAALVEMMYYFPDDKWNYVYKQFENCLNEARTTRYPYETEKELCQMSPPIDIGEEVG